MIRVFDSCKAAAVFVASALMVNAQPFQIEVVDRQNGWPVPLVELRTTHQQSFFTDNAGLIAMDSPELMNRETWFAILSDGYQVPQDGFKNAGIRVTPKPGETFRVEVDRTIIAKRLGRLTGAGLFSETERLGQKSPLTETGVMGCDSVLLARHRGKLFWLWGDTSLPNYPLGIFDSLAAETSANPLEKAEPPLALAFEHFRDEKGKLRGVAPIPGSGPTWLTGMISLTDHAGNERLVATYSKIENHLDEYETGLCVWDENQRQFNVQRVIWKKGAPKPDLPRGHPVRWIDDDQKEWILFGDPFPSLKCPATFKAWSDPATWEKLPSPASPKSADGSTIKAHRGSICWNDFRKRWITIFTQNGGKPSAFGEIWYAEAKSPLGPWGTAVKVLSHRNYTFYNPRIDHELTPKDAAFIVFEGTYTAEFANHAIPTPRYNYNQILYRLDLDDPKLADAFQ